MTFEDTGLPPALKEAFTKGHDRALSFVNSLINKTAVEENFSWSVFEAKIVLSLSLPQDIKYRTAAFLLSNEGDDGLRRASELAAKHYRLTPAEAGQASLSMAQEERLLAQGEFPQLDKFIESDHAFIGGRAAIMPPKNTRKPPVP